MKHRLERLFDRLDEIDREMYMLLEKTSLYNEEGSEDLNHEERKRYNNLESERKNLLHEIRSAKMNDEYVE